MENHYEVRQGKATNKNHSQYNNNNNSYSLKNASNRYVYTNNLSQGMFTCQCNVCLLDFIIVAIFFFIESPSDLSSNDDHRSSTYSSSSPPIRQRFANVNKYLPNKSSE